MLLKYYRVRATEPAIIEALKADGRDAWIDIVAGDMASAWRKFVTQRFGVLKPNPLHYDIRLEYTKSV